MPALRHRRTSLELKKTKSALKAKCMLARSEFFSNSSEKFLQELSTMLEVHLFLPEQEIIRAGEDGDRMYFLNWGSVEVLLADKVIGVLGSGEVFGEMALFGNGKRTCTVRAIDTSDCRSVNQHSFQRLLTAFPKERQRFEKLVEDRMQETGKVKQDIKRERDERERDERTSVASGSSRLRSITLRSVSVIAKMGVKGLHPKSASVDGPVGLSTAEPARRPRRTRPATDGEVWEYSGSRLSTDSAIGVGSEASATDGEVWEDSGSRLSTDSAVGVGLEACEQSTAEPARRPRRTRPATDGEVWEYSGSRLSTDSAAGVGMEACEQSRHTRPATDGEVREDPGSRQPIHSIPVVLLETCESVGAQSTADEGASMISLSRRSSAGTGFSGDIICETSEGMDKRSPGSCVPEDEAGRACLAVPAARTSLCTLCLCMSVIISMHIGHRS